MLGSKKYIFDTLVTPMFLYGMEVWGWTVVAFVNPFGKSVKMSKNIILTKFLQVKKPTPYTLLLLETRFLPIEIMVTERVVEYMLIVKKSPSSTSRITYEASKKTQKTHKSNLCVLIGCKIWKNSLEVGKYHTCFMMHQYIPL